MIWKIVRRLPPKIFQKTIERTIETAVYCFKNNGLPPQFFPAESQPLSCKVGTKDHKGNCWHYKRILEFLSNGWGCLCLLTTFFLNQENTHRVTRSKIPNCKYSIPNLDIYWVTQKKYSCLIKREMHNKRGFFKSEIWLDCQWANLNFDIFVLIFFVIWRRYECLKSNSAFWKLSKMRKR